MTIRPIRIVAAALFAVATLLTGATQATAAPASTTATVCDGWTIRSAAHVTGRGNTYGAIQLLRNYCHADGDDYIIWLGRGFIYGDLPGGDYLNVQLQDRFDQVKTCNVTHGNGAYCTTPPQYQDITGNNTHQAKADMWHCGPDCGASGFPYAHGETATI